MTERPSSVERLLSVGYVLRMAALALVDRVDTKYADAINGPEDYPPVTRVEAPVATEEELSLPRHDAEDAA